MEELKRRIECVIYDCDGVLFDSLEANRKLYNRIAASMGRDVLSPDELRYCHTHTVYEAIHRIFGHDEDIEKKALDLLKQLDLGEFVAYLKMEPHLLDTLEELKKRGVRRSICTNRTTSMKRLMERFELWPHFDMVVTALDVTRPKPNPECVEKILATLQAKREETLFVGDSEVDRDTARSSGVRFVAYKNRELAADYSIENHLTLLSFLGDGLPPRVSPSFAR